METTERARGVGIEGRSSIVRVALASWIGTAIEWYDFYLYGTLAALVFNKLFFPTISPLAGTLAAFATFWVGFGARPVGGILFGHFGDRIGRKAMLVFTLLLMGIATTLIGLLPTYANIGIWAAVLLVTLRFIQGFAVGGEWGGAVLLAMEHSPRERRGLYSSWPQMGTPAGLLLSTLMVSLMSNLLSPQQFLAFGWRIPFLLSILLVIVGVVIRLRIAETPEFQQVKQTHSEAKVPLVDLLRENIKEVLLVAGAFLANVGAFYLYITFILSYGTTQLGIPRTLLLNATLIGACLLFVLLPLTGALSDATGRRPIYMAGVAYVGVTAFPIFWLLETRSPALIILSLCIAMIGIALMYGPTGVFFGELFGTRVRYSGASLGYQLGSVFGGGLAPFIATALLALSGGASWPIALYLIIMVVISLVATFFLRETHPRPTLAAVRE